jgi:hypothetical protein
MQVRKVEDASSLTASTLYRRFKTVLGRSPLEQSEPRSATS